MSGQQIGTAVGFVVGMFFGAPQLGAAIGGMIGGWISPTQVNGPHIGDQADQSSQEGQPIPWVIGTCGWIQGNIVDKSKIREVKKTDDGKGSGTEVNTFEAHQDFFIMICESSEHRDSLMAGVLIVKVDGKIVYDMRPESNFGADNAKFLKNHTFYDGNEAQLPDPTMEALPHNGVGNTPYYRGVYTMGARDINLSQYGERIPVYQFVMVGAGETVEETTTFLQVPEYSSFVDSHWPLQMGEEFYDYNGQFSDEGVEGSTIAEIMANATARYGIVPDFYLGYSASETHSFPQSTSFDRVKPQATVVENESVILLYSVMVPTYYIDESAVELCPFIPDPGPGSISPDTYSDWAGSVIFRVGDPPGDVGPFEHRGNCGDGTTLYGAQPLSIQVTRKKFVPDPTVGDPCLLGRPTLLPDSNEFVQDCEGHVFPKPTYAPAAAGGAWVLRNDNFGETILGPALHDGDPLNTQAFWEPAYAAAVAAGKIEAGLTWPADYPEGISASKLFEATVVIRSLQLDSVGLDTVLTRIAVRGGLTADDIDVSEMDQNVDGYMVTQSYTGADSMRPLMTAYKCYGSEYDAKLRFHKHGEDADLIIDAQDIIQGTEESDQDTRDQQVVFPRKYSLTYIDATQDYTARPQVDIRTSIDVRAIGEIQTQVAVVLPPDYARQLANVGMKVNWARAVGDREFSVPYAGFDVYLQAVAGKPFFIDSQRRIFKELSLEDGEIKVKGAYDRQSAYTSDIQATPALPPTPPPSNIGGVTLSAFLNIGVLRDQDDRNGMYIAVAGLLPNWPGCLLQWSVDDGVSWQTAIASMTQSSVIGYLREPLPLAPASGDDVTNTLKVSVHGGQLNTITRQQYLNETNPYAIVKDPTTGQCEIGQFQFANETTQDSYDLTTLVRGGLGSTPSEHFTGARFVFLDSVYFLEIPSSYIGRTILFRPVTFGTPPENNASYAVLFQPSISQTEWQPVYLTGRYTGSAFVASVTPRHRLGNDVSPIASQNFTGYRWTLEDGDPSHSQQFDTTDPSAVFELADFDSPATITVAQLNRITGPGPSTSITI